MQSGLNCISISNLAVSAAQAFASSDMRYNSISHATFQSCRPFHSIVELSECCPSR